LSEFTTEARVTRWRSETLRNPGRYWPARLPPSSRSRLVAVEASPEGRRFVAVPAAVRERLPSRKQVVARSIYRHDPLRHIWRYLTTFKGVLPWLFLSERGQPALIRFGHFAQPCSHSAAEAVSLGSQSRLAPLSHDKVLILSLFHTKLRSFFLQRSIERARADQAGSRGR
jgi:hypothetical protein